HSLLSEMTEEWKRHESVSFFRSQTLFQQLILQLFTLHNEDICDTTHAPVSYTHLTLNIPKNPSALQVYLKWLASCLLYTSP
ncbi:hypothetical protein ACQ4LK_20795, partial [Bacillus pumilus]